MVIKEAKQRGSQVYMRNDKQTGTSVSGNLIDFTPNAVYVENGQNINIYTDNGGFKSVGRTITLNGGETVMCGNCVGIKKNGRINFYDENGKSANSRNV